MENKEQNSKNENIDIKKLSPNDIYHIAISYFCCFYEKQAKNTIIETLTKLDPENKLDKSTVLDMANFVPNILLKSIENVFNNNMQKELEKQSENYILAIQEYNENILHDSLYRDSTIRASDITEQNELLLERAYLICNIKEKIKNKIKNLYANNNNIWIKNYNYENLFTAREKTYILNTIAETIIILQKYNKDINIDETIDLCIKIYEHPNVINDFENKVHIMLTYLTIIRRIIVRAKNKGMSINQYTNKNFGANLLKLFDHNDKHYIMCKRTIDGKEIDPFKINTPLELIRIIFGE